MEREQTFNTIEELQTITRTIMDSVLPSDHATVFALHGELGAGKTALVKEIGNMYGVAEGITSPTFVVMKSYGMTNHPVFATLIHIDAYRIEAEDEMRVLRFADLLHDPKQLICIEWPENITNCIPPDAHKIFLNLHTDGSRSIRY